MKIQEAMSIYEKLDILSDAAKYDVACTSSGIDRKGDGKHMGNIVLTAVRMMCPGLLSRRRKSARLRWSFIGVII